MSDTERPYVALASDGDYVEDVGRDEAFEWADEHLAMLEELEPEGKNHWVQVTSYQPSYADNDPDRDTDPDHAGGDDE